MDDGQDENFLLSSSAGPASLSSSLPLADVRSLSVSVSNVDLSDSDAISQANSKYPIASEKIKIGTATMEAAASPTYPSSASTTLLTLADRIFAVKQKRRRVFFLRYSDNFDV